VVSQIVGGRRSKGRRPVDDEGRMPFIEHVRELRSRLFKSVLAVVATTVIAYFFYKQLFDFLTGPACHIKVRGVGQGSCPVLVFHGVLSPFSLQLKVSLAVGLLAASPIWLYQLWAFLAPGLHRNEKRYTVAFVATGVPLFLAGTALCYVLLPKALQILLGGFTPGQASNSLDPNEYLMFVIRMALVFGLSFELPLILLMLNFVGILSAKRMLGWWRMMVLGIAVFAAVATPTGDPLTMSILAVPMVALYFGAVLLAALNDRRRGRRELESGYGQVSDDEASVVDTRPSRLDDMDDIS
jgi:sec-independent protein translocase protein TatC